MDIAIILAAIAFIFFIAAAAFKTLIK